ncbi:MAG: hypothetical protein U0324_13445 [Polyangiales bacterium]
MSGAPTPAPHVPVSILLAGGSAAFSADCVKAFMQCNIHPDMIGSHGAVAARTAEARRVVETYERAVREGRERIPPEPTFAQRWMASSTAGHLAQDAAHRAGGDAGNNCATIVDGYTYHGAPAMATLGRKGMRGTVEDDLSALEERQANARRAANPPGDSRYARDDRHADERERASAAVRSQQRHFPQGLNNTPMNTATAGSPRGDRQAEEGRRAAVNRAGSAARGTAMASPSAPAPAGAPGEAHVPVVDNTNKRASPVDQAIECLQKYIEDMRGDAARRAAIDQEIARQRNDPAVRRSYEDERRRAEANVARARVEEQRAHNNARRAEQRRDGLRAVNARASTERSRADLAAAESDLAARRAAQQAAVERSREARRGRDAAERLHPERQIRCLRERRARIGTPDQRTMGRIPGPGEGA